MLFGRLFFALENYPTYCMYRRGDLVTDGGKGKPHWIVISYEISGGVLTNPNKVIKHMLIPA